MSRNVGQPWRKCLGVDAAKCNGCSPGGCMLLVAGCRRARGVAKGRPARKARRCGGLRGVLLECRSQAGPAPKQAPLLLSANKVLRGFEPRSLDSESRVLAVSP